MSFDGAEAIDRIVYLTREGQRITEAPDFRHSGRYFVRNADGSVSEHTAIPGQPDTTFFDTESLAAMIDSEPADLTVEVFFSPRRIVALVHDVRLRTHTLPIERHPAFARIARLADTEMFSQRGLIRLLRAELNGYVDPGMIERFRRLKLRSSDDGTIMISQGRAAVDRKIQEAVRDAGNQDIPDEITVEVPVCTVAEVRDQTYETRILIEAVPGDMPSFELTAVANDLAEAEAHVMHMLAGSLEETVNRDVPLYYGDAGLPRRRLGEDL